MSNLPTMAAQVARMRQLYPDFWVDCYGWVTVWTGVLIPIRRPYTVQVTFIRRFWIGDLEAANSYEPVVRLLDPKLILRHPQTGAFAEHLYWDFEVPEQSALCTNDPAARPREWNWDQDYVADRIIPWTAEWLAFYEGWLATGEWKGGGRHPEIRRSTCPTTSSDQQEPNLVQQASPRPGAFHSVGRKIGTFASLPLMAAASVASSLPMCWPRWNIASWEAGPSLPASILSSARPPGAFSRSVSAPALPPANSATFTATGDVRFFQQAA